jgi:hypothetical protein
LFWKFKYLDISFLKIIGYCTDRKTLRIYGYIIFKNLQIKDQEASASFDYKDEVLLEITLHDKVAIEWKTIHELPLTAQNSNAPKKW